MNQTTTCTSIIASAALAFAAAAHAEQLAVVVDNAAQELYLVDTITPNQATLVAPISGLAPGEKILGLDYRPLTRALFAVGSTNVLYIVDRHTAVATMVSTAPFSTFLAGVHFGFDFNPTIDRIRNVSDTNQNLVLNPNTGAVQAVATSVFYAAGDANVGADPNVVHHAYNNNFVGATTAQLFALDTDLDMLVKQANNAGTLTTVGPLGADFLATGGFDISGLSGIAFGISTEADGRDDLGMSTLYSIDLLSGGMNWMGIIAQNDSEPISVTAMTVVPFRECPSDFNHDGKVDGVDLGLMLASWGSTADLCDVNDDNTVDGADWGFLGATWGPCN